LEASRDAHSGVSADDAQKILVEESRNAGVPAFTFDPDASPAEKRAEAKAVGNPPRPTKITLPAVH
jgi:hypothetical protein